MKQPASEVCNLGALEPSFLIQAPRYCFVRFLLVLEICRLHKLPTSLARREPRFHLQPLLATARVKMLVWGILVLSRADWFSHVHLTTEHQASYRTRKS